MISEFQIPASQRGESNFPPKARFARLAAKQRARGDKYQIHTNKKFLAIGHCHDLRWIPLLREKLDSRNWKFPKGFTLIEISIYMGLLSVLLLVFTDIFASLLSNQLSTQSISSVAQDGRYVYSRLIYDVNRATSVSAPLNLGDVTDSLQLTIAGQEYTYSVSNGNIILTDQSGSTPLNGYNSSISGLSFRRIGNVNGKHTFRINFIIQSRTSVRGKYETKNFQTTAGLR